MRSYLAMIVCLLVSAPTVAEQQENKSIVPSPCHESAFSFLSRFAESSASKEERSRLCSPEALAIYSATKLDETYNVDSISDAEFRGSLQHGPQPQPSLAPSMNTGVATFGLPPSASKPENDRKMEKLPGHSNLSK